MRTQTNDTGRRVRRVTALGIFFLAVCLVYIVIFAVMELNSENIGGHAKDGTTQRTVIVQAMRGEIYDRNGKPLVTNEYTYSLTVDYSILPSEPLDKNAILLKALEVLYTCGEGNCFADYRYPFLGVYPDVMYSSVAELEGSADYEALVDQFTSSGLRSAMIRAIKADGKTTKEATAAFDASPLTYITAQDLLAYFIDEYQLEATDEAGNPLYTDTEINSLLHIYWGMEASGFSRANDYIMAKGISMATITCEKELALPGIGFATAYQRVYQYPGYASHILGQTGPIYAEEWPYYKELGYNMNATVGKSGCEAAFESYLHGQDGVKVIVEDDQGRVVDEYMKVEAVAGKDVYLTIDIDLQIAAEDGLRENVAYVKNNLGKDECEAGAISVMDPNTGEVLALASYPTYDLSTFSEDYDRLEVDDALPLYNRALLGLYAPGSTFKPAVTAAALMDGVIRTDTQLECAGVYTYYKSYQPKCWIYNSNSAVKMHGWITADDALRVSCNCYYYETGRLLGIERMNHYCTLFGLGQSTGIELGEATGILAGPAYREANKQKDWMATDTIAAAIGQSDNAFTPLQLSVYLSTLVNGGTRYSAHLLMKAVDISTDETVYSSAPTVLDAFTLNDSYRQEILYGMEQVITSSGSISSWMSRVPVKVAGKTGTAQVGGNQNDNGLFVCCAPSRNPEIVVASVIEKSGGGSYAALVAARVLEEYYK
ncbi:MAG: hypothetical protein IJW00_00960 [Clostridia bacterium]|nr:hypothetical protein [Clostridia bacterium]